MSEAPNRSLFEQLQEILLKEEREYALNLRRKIDSLETDNQNNLKKQQEDFEKYKATSHEIREQLKDLIEKVRAFSEKEISDIKEDANKISEEVSAFKSDYNKFHNHVVGFESGVETFKHDVDIFKEEVGEFKEEVKDFKEEITHFKTGIEDPDKFKNKIQPVIEEKIGYMKTNFNEVFGQEMKHSIKVQMTESKEDFIEAMYPLMGKLVKSYVKNEFEKLFESINTRLDKTFSYRSFINRIKSYFTGIRYEELAIKNALASNIEEVYIIHRESGLLIGNYSRNNTADVDMVAGMLAAIKQFAEDTFKTAAGDDLETIEYGSNKVMIQSFYRYYVATVVTGVIDTRFKSKLNNHLLGFSEKNLSKPINQIDSDLYDNISKKLKLSFYEFEEINQ